MNIIIVYIYIYESHALVNVSAGFSIITLLTVQVSCESCHGRHGACLFGALSDLGLILKKSFLLVIYKFFNVECDYCIYL